MFPSFKKCSDNLASPIVSFCITHQYKHEKNVQYQLTFQRYFTQQLHSKDFSVLEIFHKNRKSSRQHIFKKVKYYLVHTFFFLLCDYVSRAANPPNLFRLQYDAGHESCAHISHTMIFDISKPPYKMHFRK